MIFFFFTLNLLTGKETEYSHELKKKKWSFTSSTSKNEETMKTLGKNYVFKGFPNKAISIFTKKETGNIGILRYILVPNYLLRFIEFLITLE